MQTDRPLMKVLFAVLCVLAALSLVAMLVCVAAACLSDRALYRQPMQSADYIATVRASLNDELETVSLITELPIEKLMAAVTDEQLMAMSLEYADNVCDYVTGQTGTLSPVTLPQGAFAEAVADSPEADLLTEELHGVLRAAVTPVGEGHLLGYVRTVICRVAPLVRAVGKAWPFVVAFFVLCLGGACALCYRRAARLYALSGAVWTVSALAAVALWVFGSHPWMQRLVLGESALRVWLVDMYDTVMGTSTTVASVLFALCSVWLIASVVWCVHQKESA